MIRTEDIEQRLITHRYRLDDIANDIRFLSEQVRLLETERTRGEQPSHAKCGYDYMGKPQKGGWGPEWWGITLKQMHAVKQLPTYVQGMSARVLVEQVIKEQTIGTGMGYALFQNESAPLMASNMVSHCWDECYEELLAALEKAPNETEGHFWVCFLAQYQNEDGMGPSISEQIGQRFDCDPEDSLKCSSFATVLKCTKEQNQAMYAVNTYRANIYERMWCIYEMYTCLQLGVDVQLLIYSESKNVAPSTHKYHHYRHAGAYFLESPISSCTARCGDPSKPSSKDEEMIRGLIEKSDGTYAKIDKEVEKLRAAAFAKGKTDVDYHARWTTIAVEVLQQFREKATTLDDVWHRAYPGVPLDPTWEPFVIMKSQAKDIMEGELHTWTKVPVDICKEYIANHSATQ